MLTAIIFLYPTQLHYQNAIIQSVNVFPQLPLFGALYYAWFVLILVLLLLPGGKQENRDWQNVALLAIFVLVFSGLWIVLSHGYFGVDSFVPAGGAKFLLAEGRLDYPMTRGVVEFPTLTLLTFFVSRIAGLEIFDAITLFLLFQALLFSFLIYLLFGYLVKDGRLASLGTMIVIAGSMTITDFLPQLHPRITGLLFLVACLTLLTKDKSAMFKSQPNTLLLFILLAAITITHAVTSFVFLLILLGIYLVQRLSKTNLVNTSLITLAAAVFFSYEIYVAIGMSHFIFSFIPTFMRNLFSGEFFSYISSRIIYSNVGGAVPLWANVAIIFWLLLIVSGGLLGLRNLQKIKRLNDVEKKMVGGLVGITLFMAISGAASQMMELLNRSLFYLPLFTASMVAGFLSNLRGLAKTLTLVVFILLLFILSFPTFLAHNDAVATSTLHPSEIAYAEFLGSNYKQTDGITIFTSSVYPIFINYHALNLQRFTKFPTQPPPATPSGIWTHLDYFTKAFMNTEPYQTNILVFSPRIADHVRDFIGTDITGDPRWQELLDRLSQQALIYNNGFSQIYQAEGAR
ncbi:hypothetical protein ACFLV4_02095 [Chloroflexota bacterium]